MQRIFLAITFFGVTTLVFVALIALERIIGG
jgi:hypothetical protein